MDSRASQLEFANELDRGHDLDAKGFLQCEQVTVLRDQEGRLGGRGGSHEQAVGGITAQFAAERHRFDADGLGGDPRQRSRRLGLREPPGAEFGGDGPVFVEDCLAMSIEDRKAAAQTG